MNNLLLPLISLALFAYLIFFLSQFYNIVFRGYAPLVSTDRETIRRIIGEVRLPAAPTVYELGCGRAKFLRQAEKAWPAARLIGVENLSSLYLFNKIKLGGQGSRIELRRQDLFAVDLQTADLIYCYLNPTTMAKLGEKFRRECRPGTQIVSRSFPIHQLMPEKVMRIKDKEVYFYRI